MKAEDVTIESFRPGYYLATAEGMKPLQVEVKLFAGLPMIFEATTRATVNITDAIQRGWTFTRLVPAEEVEKAWEEGYDDGLERDRSTVFSTPSQNQSWEASRAKRIAEGLE